MILEIREQEPFAHFGFNRQSIEVNKEQEVTVWQDKIYIKDYEASITSVGATIVSTGLNKSILKFDTAGTYTIRYNVSNKDKTQTKISNILTITVTPIAFGSKTILWGNTNITFND